MAPVTLPPSFFNSFWSSDYRTGLEVLFKQLEHGCLENNDVVEFIDAQIRGHHALAATILIGPSSPNLSSSSPSLQNTISMLRNASSARGEAHRALAIELESRVLLGFAQWKDRHQERVKSAKEDMLGKNGVIKGWEKDMQKANTSKQTYLSKSRAADDSEDDAKFAPATTITPSSSLESYTSPKKPASVASSSVRRAGTVADRISEKMRQVSLRPAPSMEQLKPILSVEGKTLPPPPSPLRPSTPEPDGMRSPTSPTREEGFIPPSTPDGKPTITSAEVHTQPPPILLSGLSLPAQGLKELLQRFDAYLLTTPAPYSDASVQPQRSNAALASRARSTILGTYERTFSGEELVEWLRQHVEGFGSDWHRCVDAATELHQMGHVNRAGVGRGFEPQYDTYYTLKVNPGDAEGIKSPLSPATSTNISNILKTYQSYLPAALNASDEPLHVRLRREATKADEQYRDSVDVAEASRLEMEERIERGLRLWERWERERLSALRQVLDQYEAAITRLPKRLAELQSETSLAVEAFNPEADIKALIEGNRTGPFQPHPHIYESIESDVPSVNFGIDLRRWSGDFGWKSAVNAPKRDKSAIPEVLQGMLQAIEEMSAEASDDGERSQTKLKDKRKAWIYEVPLHETHLLRQSINSSALSVEDVVGLVKRFNLPIAAGVVKLYFVELNPPVMGWEGWEDAKGVYPSVGADQERDVKSALSSVLGRLPAVQLFVLNAIVKFLKGLIDGTKTEESNEIYISKLSLSLGRCFLRPQFESDVTIQDRTPSLFLADLLNQHDAVFPALLENKQKESQRVMPVRKRTALVDQRISRSSLPAQANPQSLLEAQIAAQHPRQASPAPSPPAKSPPAAPAALPAAMNLGGAIQTEPPRMVDPDDSDDETSRRPIGVQPPTPQVPESETMPEAPNAEALGADGEEDKPVAGGAGGLKRATSGETAQSRLRGPRGARGPRAQGAKPDSSDTSGRASPAGERPAGARGNVSAMTAAFENR